MIRSTISTMLLIHSVAAAEQPEASVQIAGAVMAVPEELRAGAAVLGRNAQGVMVKLREGSNELVCLIATRQTDVQRGLLSQGFGTVHGARAGVGGAAGDRAEAGGPAIPGDRRGQAGDAREPRTLYVLTVRRCGGRGGSRFVSTVVIYIPYATAQSTGLSTKPTRGPRG